MESNPLHETDARPSVVTSRDKTDEEALRRTSYANPAAGLVSLMVILVGLAVCVLIMATQGSATRTLIAAVTAVVVHVLVNSVLRIFNSNQTEALFQDDSEDGEILKERTRRDQCDERLQRIVDDVSRQTPLSAAITTLFRHLIPSAKHGFAVFFQVRNRQGEFAHGRGLSRSAREKIKLDESLLSRLEQADYALLRLEDLRDTKFAASMALSDRHKIRDIHLFRVAEGGVEVGIVASTQLFPSRAEFSAINLVHWSRKIFAGVAGRLLRLSRQSTQSAEDSCQEIARELNHEEGESDGATPNRRQLPKLFLKILRQKLCVDRISVYRYHKVTTPFDQPEPIAADGVPIPPSVARIWRDHERRLLAVGAESEPQTLDRPALQQLEIDSLISSAAVFPVAANGETLALMTISHRGRWRIPPKKLALITGCIDILAEQLSQNAAKERPQSADSSTSDSAHTAEQDHSPREEFLAVLSHELRTPVSGILGMTELALNTEMTDEQREYLSLVRSSSQSLMTMLNDVLDLSKLEAGGMELESIPFNLQETIADTLKSNAVKVHEKGLELCLEFAENLPETVLGDPLRLRQVLINLVGNAAKFTETGEVTVSVDAVAKSSERCTLRFRVRDTGIGIAPDAAERIFEKYAQSDSTVARRYGGTGLGLPICREIVECMGGQIGVDSEPGRGSTFHFTADFGIAPQSPSGRLLKKEQRRDGLVILIIDDHPVTRRVLCETASTLTDLCKAFATPKAALTAVRECCDDEQTHAIIVLDAHLKEGDAVTEMIANTDKAHRPDLILLKSIGTTDRPTDEDLAVVAQTLLKPVGPAELLETIISLECKRSETHDVTTFVMNDTPLPASPRYLGLRVLVAEDNAVNQFLACSHLESLGCEVTIVESGRAAVETTLKERFDLVLMDLMMPVLDGITATMEIRHAETKEKRRTAIVALSAHNRPEDRQRCRDAGIDGYLTKPISCEELEMALDSLIKNELIDFQAPTRTESPSTDPEQELLSELLEIFQDIAPELLDRLRNGINTGTASEVQEAAHSLKGAVSCLGESKLEELTFQLERMGEEERLDTAAATFQQVEIAVSELLTRSSI